MLPQTPDIIPTTLNQVSGGGGGGDICVQIGATGLADRSRLEFQFRSPHGSRGRRVPSTLARDDLRARATRDRVQSPAERRVSGGVMEHVLRHFESSERRNVRYRSEVCFSSVIHIALNFYDVVARDDNYCLISFTRFVQFHFFINGMY